MPSFDPVLRLVGVAAALAALTLATGASAKVVRSDAIEPGTRVSGMLVVQGLAREADVALFGFYCDPVVLTAGRRTRVCSTPLPSVRRIFVGHGIWAVSKQRLDSAWRVYAGRTEMWIDGQRVSLARFGHSDRWLLNFPAADGRDALLREWTRKARVLATCTYASPASLAALTQRSYRFAGSPKTLDATTRFALVKGLLIALGLDAVEVY